MTTYKYRAPLVVFLMILLLTLFVTGCAGGKSSQAETSPNGTSGVASPSASASASPSTGGSDQAVALLNQAKQAAEGLDRYAFTLQLTQKLSGGGAADSDMEVDNRGRVERSPLRVDQSIDNVSDGEKSSIRAILVPDTYYVYDPELEEWGKLAKEQTQDVIKTLSDYQKDPAAALASLDILGSSLKSESGDDGDVLRYEGDNNEALPFLRRILEGTLDLNNLDTAVQNSIQISSIQIAFTLDKSSHLPLAYKVDSIMTIEYEAGKPATLHQTFAGTYSEHNATKPIVVPEEAKKAPQLDEPIDDPEADL